MNGNQETQDIDVQVSGLPLPPDEWPDDLEYPVMPGFAELAGFNHAKTLEKRLLLEDGYKPLYVAGQIRRSSKLTKAIRVLVKKLATIRRRLDERAPRVVARTVGDHFIGTRSSLFTTETGAGFRDYRSVTDLRAENRHYRFINIYALSWYEAALAQDYLEAVITQTAGRHGWRDLPVPSPEEDGYAMSWEPDEAQTYEQMLNEMLKVSQRPRPPQPRREPADQMAAFLRERCEKIPQHSAEADIQPELPQRGKAGLMAKNNNLVEIEAAVLMAALEDWSVERSYLPPSRKSVGQYMTEWDIPKRESNGRTYYQGLRWKAVPLDDAG